MTVVGFNVTGQRSAIAWCDSETYVDGEPWGSACKMAVNALGGFLGIGTGLTRVIFDAHDAMLRCATLDQALGMLPAKLRQTYSLRGPASDVALSPAPRATYAVIGNGSAYRRCLGWVMSSSNDFIPEMRMFWCRPGENDLAADVIEEHSARAAASRQLMLIRDTLPAAAGGTVLVGCIDGAAISLRPMGSQIIGAPQARDIESSESASPSGGDAVGGRPARVGLHAPADAVIGVQ